MKKIKIKWKNIFKFIIMLLCLGIVLHDFYMVSISQFFTGQMVGWSWFGFITFFIALFTLAFLYEDLFNKEVF